MSDSISTSASAATSLTDVGTGHWSLDPSRSSAHIQHKSMWGLVMVKGSFTGISGEGELRADRSAAGTLTIATASIDTGHRKRDTHLRSADFFDVDRHPSIVFTADNIRPDAQGNVEVAGELTINGVTRPMTFAARTAEVAADAVTLTAEVIVDRAEFGMSWNRLGMMKGLTTVAVTTHFTRDSA